MPILSWFRSPNRTTNLTASCVVILIWNITCVAIAQNVPTPAAQAPAQLPDEPVPMVAPPGTAASSLAFGDGSQLSPETRSLKAAAATDVQITIPKDTRIRVITGEPIGTNECRAGDTLSLTVVEDVRVADMLAIPRGAALRGTVVQCKQSGTLIGRPNVVVRLASLGLEGRTYFLNSYDFKVSGENKTRFTETNVAGGVAIGGLIGNAIRKDKFGEASERQVFKYVAAGAAVGAAAGIAVSAVTVGPAATIPAESQIDFYLSSPFSILPVSPEEAERLWRLMQPSGPVLLVHGETQGAID